MSVIGTFRTCLISELSLLSVAKRKLDLETPKGRFWRKADIRQSADVGKVPKPEAASAAGPDFRAVEKIAMMRQLGGLETR